MSSLYEETLQLILICKSVDFSWKMPFIKTPSSSILTFCLFYYLMGSATGSGNHVGSAVLLELGFIRSRELLDNLHHMVRNSQLHIIDGNKVIEIRVSRIDKGSITKRILENNDYDFVMAIGDDKTDEDMFRILSENACAYTIKIGPGHTQAQFHLTDQLEALRLLSEFVDESELVDS